AASRRAPGGARRRDAGRRRLGPRAVRGGVRRAVACGRGRRARLPAAGRLRAPAPRKHRPHRPVPRRGPGAGAGLQDGPRARRPHGGPPGRWPRVAAADLPARRRGAPRRARRPGRGRRGPVLPRDRTRCRDADPLHPRRVGGPPGRLRPAVGGPGRRDPGRPLLPAAGRLRARAVRVRPGVRGGASALGRGQAGRSGGGGARGAGGDRVTPGEGDGPAPEPPPAAAPLDWPERRRALEDLDTTLLVEAGAGSGKTTLLLGRIVALLRSGRARLSEIAAITFTEKAATDLKLRLRGELERAGLAEALRELESARIGTIHAFVAGLLRERPVEAGVDPGFTVADPLAARLLQDAAWEAWLPEALAEPGAAEPVREALERGVGLERLRALAYALVEERDHLAGLPPPAPYPEPPEALNADARAIIARLEARARDGARDPDDRAVGAIATLGAWAQQTAALPAPEQVRALLASAPLPPRADRLGNQARWRDRTALAACRTELA